MTTPPPEFSSELQRMVYAAFSERGIPLERVDTDPGLTMDDCRFIDAKIGVRIVTTVLSAILPSAAGVHLVMDRSVAEGAWFACTDGTPTCFVKVRTRDLLEKYLSGKQLIII